MLAKSGLAIVLSCLCLAAPLRVAHAAPPAQRWVAALEKPWVQGPQSLVTLRTARPGMRDELTVEVSTRADRVRLQVVSPGRWHGSALVAWRGKLWQPGPRGRLLPLPSGACDRGWLGSHFTPADLLGLEHLHRDYDATATFSGSHEGVEVTEVTLTARTPQARWGKLVARLRTADGVPQQLRYYDREGMLVRRLLRTDLQGSGGAPASLRRMVDEDSATASYSELLPVNSPVRPAKP